MGDFAGEGGLEFLSVSNEVRNPSYFGVVAGGDHQARSPAGGNQCGGIGHVGAIGKAGLIGERCALFFHRQRFTGQCRFVEAQVATRGQAEIGRYLITSLQYDDIAAYEVDGREM